MDIQQVSIDAAAVVRRAGAFIASNLHNVNRDDIEEKALNSLVSFVDKEAEKILVDGLSELLPDAGFVTEEDTPDDESRAYTWIIDPLDGTTNFLNKIPHFSVSVALAQGRTDLQLGMVLEVNSGEFWSATKGCGATLDGKPISVSDRSFEDILVATGFPYANDVDYDSQFEVIKYWLTHTRGIRRMGSAALDLCYVACGRYGAYYEGYLNAWDVAAGALIVHEAGGVVRDFAGGDNYLQGAIVAAAPQIYAQVSDHIKALDPS